MPNPHDKLFWNTAPGDSVLHNDAASGYPSTDFDDDVSVLAAAARLLDLFAFTVRRCCDCLAIGDLWWILPIDMSA
jgi:hypothetical protein